MTDQTLIEQYRILHKNKTYGNSSASLINIISPFVTLINPRSILDFGCGQSQLLDILQTRIEFKSYKYDPAIKKYEKLDSEKKDMIICTDVLEHIPEDALDSILKMIKMKSNNVIFTVTCRRASYCLPDGTNCHCTVKPKNWWTRKIKKHFNYLEIFKLPGPKWFLYSTFATDWKVKVRVLMYRILLSVPVQKIWSCKSILINKRNILDP